MFTERDDRLVGEFTFNDFDEAFAFMGRVAAIASEMNHHPDMSISWNQVTVTTCTHDAGNVITDLDRVLAERVTNEAS